MDDDHHHSNREDSDDEENETLEESPCSRWLKRNERVDQCQVLGVDATFLAMDDEEGVEVVWSEIDFESKSLPLIDAKEDTICDIFDHLSQLNHPNIVKVHKFWIRKPNDGSIDSGATTTSSSANRTTNPITFPRICIITEYTSSGTLKHFLRKTKKQMKLEAWRKWCTQMLSALCYLHDCKPQIVHGNLSCDTCFISYNGLIKIGALAPDAIHRTLRTHRNESKSNLHFVAPECRSMPNDDLVANSTSGSGSMASEYSSITNDLDSCRNLSPAADVYSFGMCALQMAALEIATDESTGHITEESIQRTINGLDNALQRDLIRKCIEPDPNMRPTARELIFHAVIYEVPSLRLFCASSILNSCASYNLSEEQVNEEHIRKMISSPADNGRVLADVRFSDTQQNCFMRQFKITDFKKSDLDKFLEDVKNGGCPLTAVICTLKTPLISKVRTLSPEMTNEEGRRMITPDNPYDEETRRIVHVNCTLQNIILDSINIKYVMKIIVKLEDKINRQLTCELINEHFDPIAVTQELAYFGFINKEDNAIVMEILSETLKELPQGGIVNHERNINADSQRDPSNGYLTQPMNISASGSSQMSPSLQSNTYIADSNQLQLHSLPLSLSGEISSAPTVTGTQSPNVILPQVPLGNVSNTGYSGTPPAQIYQDFSGSGHPSAGYPQQGQIQLVHMVNSSAGQAPGPNLVYLSQQNVGDPGTMLSQPQMVQFQPVQAPPVQTLQAGPGMQFVPAMQQNVSFTQAPNGQTLMRPELSSLYPMNSYMIPAQQQPNGTQTAFQTQISSGAGTPTQTAPPLQPHYASEPLSAGYGNQ